MCPEMSRQCVFPPVSTTSPTSRSITLPVIAEEKRSIRILCMPTSDMTLQVPLESEISEAGKAFPWTIMSQHVPTRMI